MEIGKSVYNSLDKSVGGLVSSPIYYLVRNLVRNPIWFLTHDSIYNSVRVSVPVTNIVFNSVNNVYGNR